MATRKKTIAKTAAARSLIAAFADGRVQLSLGFAWQPKITNISIVWVKANGMVVTPVAGQSDSESPYKVSLGFFSSGDSVRIQWKITAYGDLNILQASTNVGTSDTWPLLPDASKALADGETWTARVDFVVPA